MKLPFFFRFLYKSEVTLGLIVIGFTCIFIYGIFYNGILYYDFKTDYSKRLILGKMKVTYYKGSSARSSGRWLSGNIIGNNNPLNCKDCIQIDIGSSSTNYKGSEYYDEKYANTKVGDTVLVWYTDDFKYKQIVPQKSSEDLMKFEYYSFENFIESVVYFYLFFFIPFIISRLARKYYQKKYGITAEEYSQYVKIAYKK